MTGAFKFRHHVRLVDFFDGGFFSPSPCGSGPSHVGWAKLTPLNLLIVLVKEM